MNAFRALKYLASIACALLSTGGLIEAEARTEGIIVDTGQDRCFGNTDEIPCPRRGEDFFGQDAQYQGAQPNYRDNGDGTISDLNTHLMWSKAVESQKASLEEAEAIAKSFKLGGFTDWRVPNIKELYSLIDFRGYTGFGAGWELPANAIPFINTDYFDFRYGDTRAGERYIDAQWLSRTRYVSTTMRGDKTLFGVNFADGRIKGYGYQRPGMQGIAKRFFARYVRGPLYGVNHFIDNGDGTISDLSSGLVWEKEDSGKGMTWEEALRYAANLRLAGYKDWRLPNAKELQYIVDYTRSPDTTHSPALDPIFLATPIINEAGQRDFPYYWTSTTHLDGPRPGTHAVYVAFGRAIGEMHGEVLDVHGAGAQRGDPKIGASALGRGPQGDAQRVVNYVRAVRGGGVVLLNAQSSRNSSRYPYTIRQAEGRNSGTETPMGGKNGLSPGKGFAPGPAPGMNGPPPLSPPFPPQPPQTAIVTCQDKVAGAACTFAGRRGESLSGRCFSPPLGNLNVLGEDPTNPRPPDEPRAPAQPPLACRPEWGPPGGANHPPAPPP
ncbi:MAG: DUF1566 domain-containing protein [Magnetococcales bacterium]|nr:DUF1566 domain-containing protein [Magnetococcales bacterium]